jgi:hypothetical protein
MDDLDFNLDLNLNLDFDFEIDLNADFDCRYIQPKKTKKIPEKYLKYKNAETLASEIILNKDCRYFVFVDGTFIFGDLLEAFAVQNDYHIKNLTIQTLSMSQANIDSLENLINGNYVDQLNIIVSDYFFSHERNNLIKYIYERLDSDKVDFQLAVASTHCKIATFETYCGLKVVIHGSANLRSSSNIEQIMIEENESLFNFIEEINENILNEYFTINKSLRRNKLWQQVAKQGEEINKIPK